MGRTQDRPVTLGEIDEIVRNWALVVVWVGAEV